MRKNTTKDNLDKINKDKKQHRKEIYTKKRKFIDDYKLLRGCNVCGYNKCACALDFHHPNNNKDINVGQLSGSSLDRIKIEMDKCIILCANCHRELHNNCMSVNNMIRINERGFDKIKSYGQDFNRIIIKSR